MYPLKRNAEKCKKIQKDFREEKKFNLGTNETDLEKNNCMLCHHNRDG